ncbi:hypothetical protein AAHA92_08797 [Salvia divinorum]|uniref:Uncharacterized protein n=1 Tax=Salvia divinorum TaxID=28513 RepID=A0ABD1HQQ8_SALDI
MQSRFALAAAKFNRTLFPPQSLRGCATTSGRTADPAVHAVDEEDVYPTDAMQDEKRRRPPKHGPTSKDNETYTPPKSPVETAAKLESSGVGPMPDPFGQQKRRSSCAGIDGSPWPEEEDEVDRRAQREEQERDNKEYYGRRSGHGGGVAAEGRGDVPDECGDPDSPHGRVLRQLRGEDW